MCGRISLSLIPNQQQHIDSRNQHVQEPPNIPEAHYCTELLKQPSLPSAK